MSNEDIFQSSKAPEEFISIFWLIPDFWAKSSVTWVCSSQNLSQSTGNIGAFVPKYSKYRSIVLIILQEIYRIPIKFIRKI